MAAYLPAELLSQALGMLSMYDLHEVACWKMDVVVSVWLVASPSSVMQPVPVWSRPVLQLDPEVSAR